MRIKKWIKRINWIKILDVLGWIGFFYLIIYGFLKVFGIIHSPLIVDATAIASVAFFAGKYVMKIDSMENTLRYHSKLLSQHGAELISINQQLSEHDSELKSINSHLARHDADLREINKHLTRHDTELREINKHLSRHDSELFSLFKKPTKSRPY